MGSIKHRYNLSNRGKLMSDAELYYYKGEYLSKEDYRKRVRMYKIDDLRN